MVIQGLDEAVLGMRPGEVRTVVVPPRLSQRASYPDSFSPDDTLHYRVQLVDIQSDACEGMVSAYVLQPERVFDLPVPTSYAP